MYIVDSSKITRALKKTGFNSISNLASALNIHRNTIHYYLAGNPVINDKLDAVLEALKLDARDVLIKKGPEKTLLNEEIAKAVDALHENYSNITSVLFGSRAKQKENKYSDWDIGAYSSKGLSHKEFIEIALLKSDLAEAMTASVDLTNLNRADNIFLKEASKDWVFLTGKRNDWLDLQKKVATYE